MKKIALVLICVLIAIIPTFAKIAFENPDINSKDELVYIVNYNVTGTQSYKSIFKTQLKSGAMTDKKELITFYPEQMEMLSLLGQKVLQIRNKFGTARYYTSTDSISWVKLTNEIPLTSIITTPYSPSPDGKWVCYIEKTGFAAGNLVVESVSTEKKITIAENILCSYDSVPVKWAPDSTYLLYEKNGNVYFCSPDALHRGVEVEEIHRRIGRGTINSVSWSTEKNFVYIDDYIVYKINSRELYTLGLYSGIIGRGTAIGRLPFQFNPSRDEFSVNNDATGIVLAQEKKNFTYFRSLISSADYLDIVYSKPYTDSKASLANYEIFWTRNGTPVLWQLKLPFSSTSTQGTATLLSENSKVVLDVKDSGKPILSPDKTKIAFFAGNSVYVYDINSWNKVGELSGEKIENIVWETGNTIFIGGVDTIKKWNIATKSTEVITLSSALNAYWDDLSSHVVAENSGNKKYIHNPKNGKWLVSESKINPVVETQNGRFRVFCGSTPNPLFDNALYVRGLSKKIVTKPLYDSSIQKMKDKQKVALIFDAYDNADGLPKIISSLNKYKIPGTFFINGEFIRRYPLQTNHIVLNGYECASLFFTTTDLTDKSFVIDEEFITRGLGRNEDEFYACTGKELSLYWHAPYFHANNTIIQAGNSAGYEYISSPHTDIENIEDCINFARATRGGVIPITIGLPQGSNSKSIWKDIDVLINALLDANFELVNVSQIQ